MNTSELSNTLAFFSAVAYGIRRDHPAIATSVARLQQAVAAGTKVSTMGTVVKALADRALDSAAANGDTETVRLLLALGAGTASELVMSPIVFAYREAVRHGHNETAKELVASGLVPSWA